MRFIKEQCQASRLIHFEVASSLSRIKEPPQMLTYADDFLIVDMRG